MAATRSGDSATARQFGASIDVATTEGRALFLVVGKGVSPRPAVASVDGQVVAELPDGVRVLALMPVAMQATVQRHRDVALAGPVTIDPVRFARFAALLGLNGGAEPTVP